MKDQVTLVSSQDAQNSQIVPTIDNVKSAYYLANAKPDSQIKLLKGKRVITLAEIRSINDVVGNILVNYILEYSVTSINITVGKNDIKEYALWAEFLRENWNTINERTVRIDIIWDFRVTLPLYEVPQRHTMKLRIGKEIAPKDYIHLMLNSDNPSEFREMSSDASCKVDFVNQVLATQLLSSVSNWYEGLAEVPKVKGVQGFLSKNQQLILRVVDNLVPLLVVLFGVIYSSWVFDTKVSLNISNMSWLLLLFMAVYFTGSIMARGLVRSLNRKIEKYREYSQFTITKGDENAQKTIKEDNWAITRDILWKITLTLLGVVVTLLVKPIFENWIGGHAG